MKIIAHGITSPQDAIKALKNGVDSIETDVSKRIIFTRFTTQHDGIKGKLGFGQKLEPLLISPIKQHLFLDLKHAAYSLRFTQKFQKLINDYDLNPARICGRDWQVISTISKDGKTLPFYTINENNDFDKLDKSSSSLTKPAGFSIRHNLINKEVLKYLKTKFPQSEIWVWTIDNLGEAKIMAKLKIDGIITNNWEKLLKFR